MFANKIAACLAFSIITPTFAQSIFEAPKQQSAAARLAEAVAKTSNTKASTPTSTPVAASAGTKTPPAASAVSAQATVTPATTASIAPVTISEQSALQAKSLADEAIKKMSVKAAATSPVKNIVPELKPDSAIAVVLDKDQKKSTASVPVAVVAKPYLAMIMGMAGLEIAEFQMPGARRKTVKVGEMIQQWRITRIQEGSLYLIDTTPTKIVQNKKSKQAQSLSQPFTKTLRVGDFL